MFKGDNVDIAVQRLRCSKEKYKEYSAGEKKTNFFLAKCGFISHPALTFSGCSIFILFLKLTLF
jgi:hypothetical protein